MIDLKKEYLGRIEDATGRDISVGLIKHSTTKVILVFFYEGERILLIEGEFLTLTFSALMYSPGGVEEAYFSYGNNAEIKAFIDRIKEKLSEALMQGVETGIIIQNGVFQFYFENEADYLEAKDICRNSWYTEGVQLPAMPTTSLPIIQHSFS